MLKLLYLNLWPVCLRVAQSSKSGFLVLSDNDQIIVLEYMTAVLTHSWMWRIRPIFFFYENNALYPLTTKFY